MKNPLSWINIGEFLNTPEEWHAMWEGILEVFCFWKPRHKLTGELKESLDKDHHYYMLGRAIGFIALIITGLIIYKIIRADWVTKPEMYANGSQIHEAELAFTCSYPECNKPIKPGEKYMKVTIVFTDKEGHKAERTGKAHHYHNIPIR